MGPGSRSLCSLVRDDDGKNLPDGQITQNLSSPFAKNIPLAASAKSVASLRPSHPNEGRLAIVTKRAVGCGGREGCD
jgi:hypothetical protein